MGPSVFENLLFCVIDLETTGSNKEKDEIIEIGLVKIYNQKVIAELGFLVKPTIPIPEYVQNLTQISTKDVEFSPKIEEILDEIIHFISTSIIVAHNAGFDIPFLNAILKRYHKSIIYTSFLCTNILTKNIIPGLINSNLPYLTSLFSIPHEKAHRALDDAKACAQLFMQYLNFFSFRKIKKINHLYYPQGKFEYNTQHYYNDPLLDPTPEIITLLKNTAHQLNILIKGTQGTIIAFFPMLYPNLQYPIIQEYLKKYTWMMVTIKLMGPFINGLIQLEHYTPKISPLIFSEICDFIQNFYFSTAKIQTPNNFKSDYYFIMAADNLKDQFILYSIKHLSINRHIIVKMPHHIKRLENFIHSSRKLSFSVQNPKLAKKSKWVKTNFHEKVWEFVVFLLQSPKEFSHFIFSYQEFIDNPQMVNLKMMEFIQSCQFTSNYPARPL